MPSLPVVQVRELRKSYNGRLVVDGIDFEVGEGEMVGLIGSNGAGKTTTVECIQGLRRPDGGWIRVLGFDPVTDPGRVRSLIGSQLQSAALPDRIRVEEAVRLFSGRDEDALLEQFGLRERRRSVFASLSGGERQRLFLVLALVGHPRLVVLDELTQGLDPAARRSVWSAIDQLRLEGTSVLLVTHELDEAEHLCQRVIAMRSGRILDSGRPADLVDRYGGWATITFSSRARDVVERLGRLPGVRSAQIEGGRVTLCTSRRAIAEVGAELLRIGEVPDDLAVRVPSLEDALVGLLDETGSRSTFSPNGDAGEPIGAIR